MKRGATCVLVAVAWACGPVPTGFFGDPPAGHELIRAFADTALVHNLDTDSTSAEGVRWLAYAATESRAAGRMQLAGRMDGLAQQYAPLVPDSLLDDDAALDLWNRLSAQGPVLRMDIARADALTISAISVDTIVHSATVDSVTVEHRWVAVISSGRAWLDPSAGLRGDVR